MEGQKGNGENKTPSKDAFQKATLEITPAVKSTPTQTAVSLSTTAGSGSGSTVRSPAIAQAAGTKGASPFFTSPDSESKPKKSVKHLECAYHFGSAEGCKWTEETCLYSHRETGIRAGTPVTIEPGSKCSPIPSLGCVIIDHMKSVWNWSFSGRDPHNYAGGRLGLAVALTISSVITGPPVAGKNATNPHPLYHNWRNSPNEGGVEYTTRPASPSPQIAARPEVPLPLRQQIDWIRTKAAHSHNFHHPPRPHNQSSPRHFNHSQIGPIPPATPTMGHSSHNVNAQPFSSAHHKVEGATQPGE